MIFRLLSILIISLSVDVSLTAQNGSVSGTVLLPEKDPIKRMAARYRASDARSLGDPAPLIAVVYLTNASTAEATQPSQVPKTLSQRGLHFHPRILPITLGSEVAFPNEDDTFHNVFSYSPAKEFDLGRYRKDEEAPVRTFDTAGVISLFCEVHRHMQAYILVLETPHFASTDASGAFSIENVPPGEYEAVAWISRREQIAQSIIVEADKDTSLSFE